MPLTADNHALHVYAADTFAVWTQRNDIDIYWCSRSPEILLTPRFGADVERGRMHDYASAGTHGLSICIGDDCENTRACRAPTFGHGHLHLQLEIAARIQ